MLNYLDIGGDKSAKELDSFESDPSGTDSSSELSLSSSSSESESESEYESFRKAKHRRMDDNLEVDEKADIVALLSSSIRDFLVDKNGDRVKISSLPLSGKYIMICRFDLPLESFTIQGNIYWALKHASSKWSNFQLVVVAKMSPGSEHDSELFYSFLSSLPSCLAVPLDDSDFEFSSDSLILDPSGVVLQQSSCRFLIRHGIKSLPFTENWILTLDNYLFNKSRARPLPLEDLLSLKLSDGLSNIAATDTISVSKLTDKLVGLYLYLNGQLLDTVNRVYQESRSKNRELEIVLVYVSLSDDPQHYMDSVDAVLKGRGISSWWKSPLNDSTFRKLWLICDESERDELIIVGPQGRFVELKGADAITLETVHDLYPYSAEALAHQETTRLIKLSLESLLFPSINYYLVTQQGHHVHLRDLQGKKVLLFIANFDPEESEFKVIIKGMNEWCAEYKQHYMNSSSNTVLVFAPVFSGDLKFTKEESDPRMSFLWDSTMQWLICPPDPHRQLQIYNHVIPKGVVGHDLSYIVFGEDGGIVSADRPKLSNFFLPGQLYHDILLYYIDLFNDGI
ncbi:uncharacterized protein LOC110696145 [Chenopodium quinoa]|uniref:uncharacterized protein LOC110696145 n=1 Tax=Chenopodium quinoa TaxID=63459 RepID=UPI000B77A84B|nr:uncharacterized protein LOC110696145 [Chenopodium quinoa]